MDHNLKGLSLALLGAMALVPDTLLMRLSGLDALQMAAWRGLLLAAVLLSLWFLSSSHRERDLDRLGTVSGLGAVALHAANAVLFAVGIGHAPVAIVLLALATVPIWAALMGAIYVGDSIERKTLAASGAVLLGIAVSVSGGPEIGAGSPLIGATCGLAVALALSGSFTIFRSNPDLPILLAVGCGAAICGVCAALFSQPLTQTTGWLPAIWITGLVILPISFTTLNIAARYTVAANVSLLLLLETVLGPTAVWIGIGEPIGTTGSIGGAIVVITLALYLWDQRRRSLAIRRAAPSGR